MKQLLILVLITLSITVSNGQTIEETVDFLNSVEFDYILFQSKSSDKTTNHILVCQNTKAQWSCNQHGLVTLNIDEGLLGLKLNFYKVRHDIKVHFYLGDLMGYLVGGYSCWESSGNCFDLAGSGMFNEVKFGTTIPANNVRVKNALNHLEMITKDSFSQMKTEPR